MEITQNTFMYSIYIIQFCTDIVLQLMYSMYIYIYIYIHECVPLRTITTPGEYNRSDEPIRPSIGRLKSPCY